MRKHVIVHTVSEQRYENSELIRDVISSFKLGTASPKKSLELVKLLVEITRVVVDIGKDIINPSGRS